VLGDQKQIHNLQEALQKEGLEGNISSESDSKEEVDTTNMCFMANENTLKVTFKSSLDECELSMDELGEVLKNFPTTMIFSKRSI